MANTTGRDFMNTYHSSKDLDYVFSDDNGEWKEHGIVPTKIVQTAGQDTKDDITDDVYELQINNDYYKDTEERKFYNKDIKFKKSEIKNMMHDSTIGLPEDMLSNRFNRFSRYGYLDPTNELITGTREYLFFSKPDLHLVEVEVPSVMYKELRNVPFFNEAFNRYKLSYYSLQQYYAGKSNIIADGLFIDLNNKYINLLSNMVTSSFDLSDISASDVMNNQNLYQINTSYREGSLASDLQYDFSLEFKDTKYLDVYMLFKIYDEYFRYKYMLDIMPTRNEYIANKIYPEALSIWKIITDDTGRIMYWAKATGCTPMSVPRGTISNIEGNIKFTVNWKAQFIKDMDPVQLSEINYLTAKSKGLSWPNDKKFNTSLFDDELLTIYDKQTWGKYPLIINGNGPSVRTGHIYDATNISDAFKRNVGFHRLVWIK